MATWISNASHGLTSGTTWAPIDSASELDSEAGSTVSTTSNVLSANITPANAAVDGVAVKVAARTAGASGTITISLLNATNPGLREGTLTINATDIDASGLGWYLFKFAAVTPNGTDVYNVAFKTSVAGTVTLYRNATAGNWCRMLRNTAAGSAPSAGDKLMMMGEWTAAATLTSFTVTMDSTATTSYGPTVSGGPPQGVTVNKGATFACGVTASTAYNFKWKGVLAVYGGGTMTVGTSGTPVPFGSTADYIMDSAANVDTGIEVFANGTFTTYGAVSGGTLTPWTLLNADYASGTSVTLLNGTVGGITVGTTGWAVGDTLGFAPTGSGATDTGSAESQTIASGITATAVVLTSGLGHAHSGTSPTQGEVVNVTRNVRLHGASVTLCGYLYMRAGSVTVTQFYTEHYWMGGSTTTKNGIVCNSTGGTVDIEYCSFHDFFNSTSTAAFLTSTAGGNGWNPGPTWSHNVSYNLAGYQIFWQNNQTFTNWGFTQNDTVHVGGAGNGGGTATVRFFETTPLCTMTNVRVAGVGAGVAISVELGANVTNSQYGTYSNWTVHTTAGVGVSIGEAGSGTISNITVWRNASGGITNSLLSGGLGITLTNVVAFGNTNFSLAVNSANLTVIGLSSNGDSTVATTSGIQFTGIVNACTIENACFGAASGILTAHTQDVLVGANNDSKVDLVFRNCTFNSNWMINGSTQTTFVNLPGQYSTVGFERFSRSGSTQAGTAGLHCCYKAMGTLIIDSTNYHTAAPSLALWPNNAAALVSGYPAAYCKLDSTGRRGGWFVPVANGTAITASVWTRKSLAADVGGTCTTNGTAVTWVSGKLFQGLSGAITINAVSYTISSVTNDKTLVLTGSAGVQASPVNFGQLYNGAQQRLIVRRNNALGITSDTVLQTAAASAGSWEQLVGVPTATVTDDGVLEFFLDCDGTTGWVNVDDFAATPAVSALGFQYWSDGVPTVTQGQAGVAGSWPVIGCNFIQGIGRVP